MRRDLISELLGGEVLAGKLTQGIWKEALKLNTPEYPTLAELLGQRIANEGKSGALTITTEDPSDYMLPAISALLGLNNLDLLSSLVRTAATLDAFGIERA